MGVFVSKAKRSKFRVFIEEWKPKRKIVTVKSENYPTYNINHNMTYEQADSAAKEYNLKSKSQKNKDARAIAQIQQNSLLNSFSLPQYLVDDFITELRAEYKNNTDRLETLEQHWKASQQMIAKLQIDYTIFFNSRFQIFEYYEKKCWSADYIKRITKISNRWGSFCARKKGTFFEPIPKIGIKIHDIVKKRELKKNIRRAAEPMKWSELRNLRTKFMNEELTLQWNWLYIGLFFGLRPSEIDSLKDKSKFRLDFNKDNNVDVIFVYQNKLKNLAEARRWKVIPIVETEQLEAIQLIKSGEFKRPLNKTLKRLFETTGIDLTDFVRNVPPDFIKVYQSISCKCAT